MKRERLRRWDSLFSQIGLRISSALRPKRLREFVPDAPIQPVRPSVLSDIKPLQRRIRAELTNARPTKPLLDPRPRISAILGSYNRRRLIELAINSLRRDLEDLRHEIIVVDGGSTDGTLDWLLSQKDVITIVQHNRYSENGKARRRMSWGRFMNFGFKSAAGDYLLMISDDCYVLPGSIASALDRIQAAQDRGLRVGACAFYFRDWPRDDRYYVQRTFGGNLMVNHGIYLRDALVRADFCDEDKFVFYKADSDLSLRIWERGFVIIDSKESICEHYVGAGVTDTIRSSNNATLDYDRDMLRRRWPQMTTKKMVAKMGKIYLEREPDAGVEDIWKDIASSR